MTPNRPGTTFALFTLIALLWLSLRLNWTVFFAVVAVGGTLNLWAVRRALAELWRVSRAPDDPMPDWMGPPRL